MKQTKNKINERLEQYSIVVCEQNLILSLRTIDDEHKEVVLFSEHNNTMLLDYATEKDIDNIFTLLEFTDDENEKEKLLFIMFKNDENNIFKTERKYYQLRDLRAKIIRALKNDNFKKFITNDETLFFIKSIIDENILA